MWNQNRKSIKRDFLSLNSQKPQMKLMKILSRDHKIKNQGEVNIKKKMNISIINPILQTEKLDMFRRLTLQKVQKLIKMATRRLAKPMTSPRSPTQLIEEVINRIEEETNIIVRIIIVITMRIDKSKILFK